MIGLDIKTFMSKVYYGDELEFKIADTTYFIQGSYNNGKYILTIDYWKKDDGTEPDHDFLFFIKCKSAEERLHEFEEASIFEGKTIYEIEHSVEVIFG